VGGRPFEPTAQGPESEANLDPSRPIPTDQSDSPSAKPVSWQAATATDNGCLDLGASFGQNKPGPVYALLSVYSLSQQPVAALLHPTKSLSFWHNGQLLLEGERNIPPEADNERVPLTLRAGWNTLLFKAGAVSGADRLCLWLSDEPADRAWAFADRGQWDEAMALAADTLQRKQDDISVRLLSGRLFRQHSENLRRQGRKDEAERVERQARTHLEKLLALRPDHAGYATELADILQSPAADHWEVLDPAEMTAARGTTLTKQPDGSILASGENPLPETYTITARTRSAGIAAVRLEVLPDPRLPGGGPGRAPNGNLCLNEFRITATPEGDPSQARPIDLHNAWADFSQHQLPVGAAIDGNPDTGWSVVPETGRRHVAIFAVKKPITFTQATILTFTLDQQHKHLDWVHNLGRLRLSVTAQPQAIAAEKLRASLARQPVGGWTTLAGAHYLRGEREAALAVLVKATAGPSGGNGWDRLLLALIHTELGHRNEAGKWRDDAFAWLARSPADEPLWQIAAESLPGLLAREPQSDNAEVRLGRARAFLALKQADKAIAEATSGPSIFD
jgi:tetratricopeptide (TPR) repeat protein